MKRQIIKIDEDKCNGCGLCVSGCAEGALQLVDGKARLVNDLHCDGLGACIGECPAGAISFEEREAEIYDERQTMILKIIPKGLNMIKAHLEHLKAHGQEAFYKEALVVLKEKGMDMGNLEPSHVHQPSGCPGSMMRDLSAKRPSPDTSAVSTSSELRQWPVQLHLLNPQAPYFKNADLVIAADCVPFAYANFHQRFLKGKILIIFCPKLDQGKEIYLEKLEHIFKHNNIRSVTIAHMEVPCCSGTVNLIEEAIRRAGISIVIKEYTVSLEGDIV